ncbi:MULTISPECIES: cadmium resistance transporter [unclassified Lacticaseibacillus]|uniref:cadmium resistance transporter n=1 Tax=unclassified Lacticaseibacillus TaxID=2759744 RepID=UPI001943A3CE|nr:MULTISPECIES: cadmium resistance transporter [unclassified Lacticaseibacillus]
MNYWLLTLTFLSVNLDFFFMLLFLLKRYSRGAVILGYVLGVTVLMTLSFAIGKTLALLVPEWALGVLGVLPLYMALRQDHDADQPRTQSSAVASVFLTYLSVCAGCNLSIFLPVLAGETLAHFGVTLIFIALLAVAVVLVINLIGRLPQVAAVMKAHGEALMRVCYAAVGLWVFWDSGLIAHLLAFV